MNANDGWYEHVLIDGRWEHAYDAYLNHQASGARAKRRGESTDWILCNCTDEQRRKHMEERAQMDPNKPPMARTLEDEANFLRGEIKALEKRCRDVKDKIVRDRSGHEDSFPGQTGEILGQITLAFRHLEDARMRIGKVIQYSGDGVSCFDK